MHLLTRISFCVGFPISFLLSKPRGQIPTQSPGLGAGVITGAARAGEVGGESLRGGQLGGVQGPPQVRPSASLRSLPLSDLMSVHPTSKRTQSVRKSQSQQELPKNDDTRRVGVQRVLPSWIRRTERARG